jgi:tetratricopeptide (TPR) repeat protein
MQPASGQIDLQEADASFSQGNYGSSLKALGHVIEKYPTEGDRALFEMGIIYAYPKNENKDYQRSLECFQDLLRNYPESEYRHDSERMIFHIHNVTLKDRKIAEQQAMIDRLRQDLACKEAEITTLQQKIEELEQRVFSMEKGPADKILIEKKKRRLSLLSKGSVIKAYRIAWAETRMAPSRGRETTRPGRDLLHRLKKYGQSLHTYPFTFVSERERQKAGERTRRPPEETS